MGKWQIAAKEPKTTQLKGPTIHKKDGSFADMREEYVSLRQQGLDGKAKAQLRRMSNRYPGQTRNWLGGGDD